MLTNLNLNNYENYSDEDLQIFANLVNAFIYAEKLKRKGIIEGGPKIDRKSFSHLLEFCDERGIKPIKEESKLMQYLEVINSKL